MKKDLQSLRLHDGNEITGTFPPEIGVLSKLRIISLGNNQMTGTIPTHLFSQLTSLELLSLYNNHFSSTIPITVGSMTNLAALYLDNNDFSGQIPTSLSQLENLIDLRLSNNSLVGTVPLIEIISMARYLLRYQI